MRPGLARAVPMGIIGFVVGALIAIVIRLAQGLDPNPDNPYAYVGPAFTLGAFLSAFTFVWGMGGFDPRMNVHGEEHHEEEAEAEEEPRALLSGYIWQVAFWTILGVLAIGAVAFLPQGPSIQNVREPEGNVAAVGFVRFGDIYQPTREFLQTATGLDLLPPLASNLAQVEVSYLVLLVVFFIITMLSLFVAAGVIGFLIHYFARGKKNPQGTALPWRGLAFIGLLVAPLLQFPLLISNRQVPVALMAPVFIIPPLLAVIGAPAAIPILLLVVAVSAALTGVNTLVVLLLFVVALVAFASKPLRMPIGIISVLITLVLPVVVPSVDVTGTPPVIFAAIGMGLLALVFQSLKVLLAERVWRIVMVAVMGVVTIGLFVLAAALNRSDFWTMLFHIYVAAFSVLLVAPVEFLQAIIPASIRSTFSAVQWSTLVPQGAAWLARLLRQGLPTFLGQK